ncbi:uncharacterized protein METZ01_LOCUS121083 [marine metagenome]|jgi:hypothetical protein|uniref:Uncharacterized protein n=1 Tax=marine metagenome TaxID=408172 RepID=A0A381XTZ1_9ZZZZ
MKRYEFEDLISDYLENSLSLKKRKDFELYLSENLDAADLVDQVRNTMLQMKSVEKVKTSAYFMDRLMNVIQESKSNTRKFIPEQSTLFGFTPLYASIMTGLALALVFVGFQLINPDFPVTTSALNTVAEEKPAVFLNQVPSAQIPSADLTAAGKDSLDKGKMKKSDKDYSGKIRFVKD